MSRGANFYLNQLREAEVREVTRGERRMAADLAEALGPEAFEQGRHIYFGDDENSLRIALGILGVARQLEGGALHLHNVYFQHGGTIRYDGLAIGDLIGHDPLDMLRILQAETVDYAAHYTPDGIFTDISQILVASPGEDTPDGRHTTDSQQPGVVLRAVFHSRPEVKVWDLEDRSGPHNIPLEDAVGRAAQAYPEMAKQQNIVGALARLLKEHPYYEITGGDAEFALRVGPLGSRGFMETIDDVHCSLPAWELVGDRLVEKVHRPDDQDA